MAMSLGGVSTLTLCYNKNQRILATSNKKGTMLFKTLIH